MKRLVFISLIIFVLLAFSACTVSDDANLGDVYPEGALNFDARVARTGVHNSYSRRLYPRVIRSMDDIAAYLEFYSDEIRPSWGRGADIHLNNVLFGAYTEDFFLDRFLVLLFFEESSGSHSLRVDAVLENGDVHITRTVPGRGMAGTDDMAYWHIVLELNNQVIPERFNLIIDTVEIYYDE
ncbi:MAG: hypothetical protein FWC72_07380 [Oscillospiraceae bacterium]|nr:hypothetical protein [Oscillospiraceae bacterium]